MKYLSLSLSLFFLFACHKTSSTAPFSYSVSKLQDDTITAGQKTFVSVQVDLLDGFPDSVTLKITGLPQNITADPSAYSHRPPYTQDFF